jgi:hypothetical protein
MAASLTGMALARRFAPGAALGISLGLPHIGLCQRFQGKVTMNNDLQPNLAVRVDPNEMVRYVQELMTAPRNAVPETTRTLAHRQWGGDTPLARAAQLRWSALNRAFGDARLSTWTTHPKRDQLHVPAALIAAAGVARLTMAEQEVVFDIPTLLDATLELCEPVGHA